MLLNLILTPIGFQWILFWNIRKEKKEPSEKCIMIISDLCISFWLVVCFTIFFFNATLHLQLKWRRKWWQKAICIQQLANCYGGPYWATNEAVIDVSWPFADPCLSRKRLSFKDYPFRITHEFQWCIETLHDTYF